MINKQRFGVTEKGETVELYTLRNKSGASATITNYGGIVVSLLMPDRAGRMGDVVLGYETLEGYLRKSPYFGCIVGRYGNRIANAKFTLGGVEYQLAANDGVNHLHGGIVGFDKVVWRGDTMETSDGPSLRLHYISPDGAEGYPGTLTVIATYTLTDLNALRLAFIATTDRDTICNLTHHSYFNLAGKGNILNHEIMLPAKHFTPVNSNLIPTGEVRPVRGTPFDFTVPHLIGERIDQNDEQLVFGKGYDHNWIYEGQAGKLTLMARVAERTTGRTLEVLSTEPAMQFYSGNFLDGTIVGKRGITYARRSGFCLEPQHYPDSPNQPAFPTTLLRKGETYRTTMLYRFAVSP